MALHFIKCIDSTDTVQFQTGKVYPIEHGYLLDDQRRRYSLSGHLLTYPKDIDEVNNYFMFHSRQVVFERCGCKLC